MKRFRYTVRGDGKFPLDMLRYDQCWPAHEHEVKLISDRARGDREVTIESVNQPETARWASFGWTVTEIRRTA